MDNRREQIVDILRREFIGPDPIDEPGMRQENGEEILTGDPPRIRYIAGVLFPQEVTEDQVLPEETSDDAAELDTDEPVTAKPVRQDAVSEDDIGEELINLSNAWQQSAMSMTAAVMDGDSLYVTVRAGIYLPRKVKDPETDKETEQWCRVPVTWTHDDRPLVLPLSGRQSFPVDLETPKVNLCFHATMRHKDKQKGHTVYTFTLENTKRKTGNTVKDEDCCFQAQFSIRSEMGFAALPDGQRITRDEDYLSNQMLYRDIYSYAIGHGCAAGWAEADGTVHEISTETFPEHEILPIVPATIEGVSLEMFGMSDFGNLRDVLHELNLMCDKYGEWITDLRTRLPSIQDKATAQRHIAACEECLHRMREGVRLLASDRMVQTAFSYMNRAMLLQQLHYNMPLQKWVDDGHGGITLEQPQTLPDIRDKATWPGEASRYGRWRPFQLAFILMNLKSMADRQCAERQLVDLIWFPTGGGKTEAYLGLSAYAIFLRRLQRLPAESTSILMRYTLRLLTAQQYERASTLICACEVIRKEKEHELGKERISIGLWVGSSSTPNKQEEAVKKYNELYNGHSNENPFVVLKCPWCGAQMGVVEKPGARGRAIRELPGYRKLSKPNRIIFQCLNTAGHCDFSSESHFR